VATLTTSTSSSSPLTVIGDDTGSIFGVSPGVVDWRGWTNDTTPIGTNTLAAVGKSYVTLKGLKITGGSGSCAFLSSDCTNWTFQDCIFVSYLNNQCLQYSGSTSGTVWNSLVDRCDFIASTSNCITFAVPLNASEYSANITVQNSRFWTRGNGVVLQSAATGSFLGTGVAIQSCEFHWANIAVNAYASNAINLTTPISIRGCSVHGAQTGFAANNTTQVAEDRNIILAQTPRTSVSIGANSITVACPAFNFNDERLTGAQIRPFMEPMATSPFVAWFTDGATPAVDVWNQNRPATASAGAIERDTFPTGTVINIFQSES
jgi:hypothetical protein